MQRRVPVRQPGLGEAAHGCVPAAGVATRQPDGGIALAFPAAGEICHQQVAAGQVDDGGGVAVAKQAVFPRKQKATLLHDHSHGPFP